jgi:hypothetical protein
VKRWTERLLVTSGTKEVLDEKFYGDLDYIQPSGGPLEWKMVKARNLL